MKRRQIRPSTRPPLAGNESGSIAILVLLLVAISLELAAATIALTTTGLKRTNRETNRVKTLNLAEAGLQNEIGTLWSKFRVSQSFTYIDANAGSASESSPCLTLNAELAHNERYTVSVVGKTSPDTYGRNLTIVSVGWIDTDGDAVLDSGESFRAIRAVIQYSLSRAHVFDYCYFVNNYGWMNGFDSSELVVNGDMRANGDFDFSGGTPTINGSVYAAPNDLLIPGAGGDVNITPTQWSNNTYNAKTNSRARQAYVESRHGKKNSSKYKKWKDVLYDNDAGVQDGEVTGAVVADKDGVASYSGTILDPAGTTTLPMPDLSDIAYYKTISTAYTDTKATYTDGTANSNYGAGAYVKVYDSTSKSYVTISTSGVVSGSATLIGDKAHPIIIHGPVTVTQDCVISGYVQGQGTVYAGRNVHIIGSVIYSDPPDFTGNDPDAIDNSNEKKSLLGLAASASVICGDPSTFTSSTLGYMTPPFTKSRYDESGNLVSAFNAKAYDSYGVMKYKSVYGDSYLHKRASTISQIDAVLYTNFLGGGDIGGSGGGVVFNGSIISKDEAMVLKSLPFKINYDNRIKERGLNSNPLIDICLPRTPSLTQMSWQEI